MVPSTSVTVFHLEMCGRNAFRPSAARPDFDAVIVDPPDPELNRRFYCSVGYQWEWTDRLSWSQNVWQRYVDRDVLKTFVGKLNGDDVGYFELEIQESGNVEIVYLGLLPEYIGKGLGGTLLSAAVERAWEFSGTERIWVHTCTHDHKHALDNYRARGFELFRVERGPLKADQDEAPKR
jgi:GNAT superfamily N-acetyltransferase